MSFIKLDRKLLTWEWKDDPNTVALWIEILLQANWEDRKWHGKEYEKGSFPTSIEKLSKATGLTTRQVRTCLEHLVKSQNVTIQSTKTGTKIIVNKWAEFQGSDGSTDKQTDKQPTKHRQRTDNTLRNKEVKEGEKIFNSIPVYDPSLNKEMSKEQEEELLELMKGQA